MSNAPAYCGTELNMDIKGFMVFYDDDFKIDYQYSLVSKHSLPTLTIKVLALLF
jgi:hypothetical protein